MKQLISIGVIGFFLFSGTMWAQGSKTIDIPHCPGGAGCPEEFAQSDISVCEFEQCKELKSCIEKYSHDNPNDIAQSLRHCDISVLCKCIPKKSEPP